MEQLPNLLSIIWNVACIGGILGVIYLVFRKNPNVRSTSTNVIEGKPKYSSLSTFTIQSFIAYLLALKSEGKQSIDDVLEDLYTKVKPEFESETLQQVSPQPIAVTQEVKTHLDTANLLLYLGAFVFSFAIFVFAVFTWSMYAAAFKIGLILFVPVMFFAAAWYLHGKERFTAAFSTFLLVGAVSLGFAGLGIWNFGNLSDLGITLAEYWVGYALVLSAVYALIMSRVSQKRRYVTLFLLSVYTGMFSFVSAYAEAPTLQIIVLVLLNIAFYALTTLWEKKDSLLEKTPRAIAHMLDAIGIVLILQDSYFGFDRIVALLILAIPFLFEIVLAITKKSAFEESLAILSFVPRIVMILAVFAISSTVANVTIALAILGSVLFAELVYAGSKDGLYKLQIRWSRILGVIITVAVVRWGLFPGFSALTVSSSLIDSVILFVGVVLSVANIVPMLRNSERPQYGIAILPAVLSLFSIFPIANVLYVLVGLVPLGLFAVLTPGFMRVEHVRWGLVSVLEMILFVVAWMVLGQTAYLEGFLVLAMAAVGLGLTFSLREMKGALYYTVPLAFISAMFLTWFLRDDVLMFAEPIAWYRAAMLVPVIVYSLIPFIERIPVSIRKSAISIAFIFSTLAVISSLGSTEVITISLCIVTVSMIALLMKSSEKGLGYAIGLFSTLWIFALTNLLDLKSSETFLFFGIFVVIVQLLIKYLRSGESLPEAYAVALKNLSRTLLIAVLFHFMLAFFWARDNGIEAINTTVYDTGLVVLGLILSATSIVLAPISERFKRAAGIGAILAVWNMAAITDASSQWYVVPVTMYVGTLAYLSHLDGRKNEVGILEFLAVTIQGFSLLTLSTTGSDTNQLGYGFILLALSLGITIFGQVYSRKVLYWGGLFFLILELYVRLQFVISLIPWWVYLAVMGLALMGAGIWAAAKKTGEQS